MAFGNSHTEGTSMNDASRASSDQPKEERQGDQKHASMGVPIQQSLLKAAPLIGREAQREASAAMEGSEGDSDASPSTVEGRDDSVQEASTLDGPQGIKERMEKLARLRREKRLALNRESARNRRKKKKEKIIHLEGENANLLRLNQQLQLQKESLAARVGALEQELAMAHATITQLKVAGAAAPLSAFPGHAMSSALGSNVTGNEGYDQLRGISSSGDAQRDNVNRLIHAAHIDHLAIQGGGGGGLGFSQSSGAATNQPNVSTTSGSFSNELLRRHAMDMQLAAARENHLGSIANMGSYGNTNIGSSDRGNHTTMAPSAAGQPQSSQYYGAFPSQQQGLPQQHPQDVGLGETRLSTSLSTGQPQNLRMDMLLQNRGGSTNGVSNQQQFLELLRQRGSGSDLPRRFPHGPNR